MILAQRRLVAVHRAHTRRLLETHEQERARVAREVHDDAIQRLVVVQHELDELGASDSAVDATRVRHLDGIRNEVQDLVDSLRRLAHRLHPSTIEHAGLPVALAQLAEEFARSSRLRVTLDVNDAPKLPPDTAIALFRIAQE
nr:histidine kinase [Gemmatimonadota bacterium]